MKENVNMNTLSATEKQVPTNVDLVSLSLLSWQAIWVPKLVFVNTEKNTKNDDKAFSVARYDTLGIFN